MTSKRHLRCIVPLLLCFCSPVLSAEILQQTLRVSLEPAKGRLQVAAEITLPRELAPEFLLHSGLVPASPTPGVALEDAGEVDGPVPLHAWRVRLPGGLRSFELDYGGEIVHPLTRFEESPGRRREGLSGTISGDGVYLDGASGWYPRFGDSRLSFTLQADLPAGWLAVSQGAGPGIAETANGRRVHWGEAQPQDEIYLVAAPFHYFHRSLDGIEAQVYLREADEALANRYLDATADYLRLYQGLLGPYPYAKFALVENFWESGYGMPSFTLLGPRVIRLPFILASSYPHEILHNWWGNSVYVDYAGGNWSEGLTSYLADHLLAERQGRGSDHRRAALQRYADFVRHDNDFPLREFRARHSTASQAVGYDKGLMLFHMLRRELGDAQFIEGLHRFYRDNRFRSAGFDELQHAFEAVSGRPLGDFFRQWVSRTGAPALTLQQTRVEQNEQGYRLSGMLRQTQATNPFRLQVPLVIQLQDGSNRIEHLTMSQSTLPFEFKLKQRPRALFIDPWFDLFRRLDPAELPPSLSQFFGAERVLILLPAAAQQDLLAGYRTLAEDWAEGFGEAEIRLDSEMKQLPDDRPVLLLGWENRYTGEHLAALSDYPFQREGERLTLWDQAFDTQSHSFALAARPAGGQPVRLWVACRSPASLPGLDRKLPHYGKYSALVFAGRSPDNRLKRSWPVTDSPLSLALGPQPPLPLPQPPPLVSP